MNTLKKARVDFYAPTRDIAETLNPKTFILSCIKRRISLGRYKFFFNQDLVSKSRRSSERWTSLIVLFFFVILSIFQEGTIEAQSLGLQIVSDQEVLFGDTLNGPGVKMMWNSFRAAVRAGVVEPAFGTVWDRVKIGSYSAAFGRNNLASESGSMSWGDKNQATEYVSTAFGAQNIASGSGGTAWGFLDTASHRNTTAWGWGNHAANFESTAWGRDNRSSGSGATAWGIRNQASELATTAWGMENIASGSRSSVWGFNNESIGEYSTAWGRENKAIGAYSSVWGRSNQASDYYATALGENKYCKRCGVDGVGQG